ncbi:MAG: tetratricopeptide repeat protein [Pyrinomonadaceae bacterium]
MLTFYDSQNQPYTLGEQLGRGGEGTVYSCEDFSLVAKIYHAPVEEEKAEKLRWMSRNKDEKLLKVAAWVVDVLYDQPNGNVVGFLMPNVRAKEIHELYSLKSRRVYFPDATWHFLVHAATNVARAFYALHKRAHVMGDVNHGNCVVLADGTVKLIDCDSFSIKTDQMRYRCDVGVATHLAPELQNVDLGEIEREANHDNFGLAVIIFQLLFLGRHPFSGNYLGAEDKSLEDCIAEHRFAYGKTAELKRVKQPPGTLSLSQVAPRVAVLFERAFSSENKNRPEPREWIEALEDLSDNLEQCNFHPGHHYFNSLTACPWCEIESQTGVMLFPFISSAKNASGEKPFNIFTIENLISNLGISTNLPAKPPKPQVLPMPSPQIVEAQKTSKHRQYMVVGMHLVILTALMAIFGVGISCFLVFLLMAVFITVINSTDKNLRGDINDRLTTAQQEWERLENEWNNAVAPKKLTEDLSQIKTRISDYQNIQRNSIQQLRAVDEKHRARAFEVFSSNYKLSNAQVSGFDESQINALEDQGIKTAADLNEKNLSSVFILNDDAKNNLLEWRETLEKNYRANNEKKLENEKTFLTHTITEKRRAMEKEIEFLLASLRSGSLMVRQRQQNIVGKTEKIAHELVQAESDMEVVGTNSFAVLALLLITFVMPFIGIILSEVTSPRIASQPPTYQRNMVSETGSGVIEKPIPTYDTTKDKLSTMSSVPDPEAEKLYVPDEKITDESIASISPFEQQEFGDILRRQAANLKYGKEDFVGAERKLRFAMRFDSNSVGIFNELADTLYQQKKYSEAIKVLDRSLGLDYGNSITKILLAMNYLELKKFENARDVLLDVTEKDNSLFEGYYRLGLAYKGLNQYHASEDAFHEAIRISPSDADSHYELGYSYYKQGKLSEAKQEYNTLFDINKQIADKLKKDTNNFK